MLTTPARSENSPPSAARPIGTASSSAAAIVDDEVSAFSPLITRTSENSTSDADDQPEQPAAAVPPPVSSVGERPPAGAARRRSPGRAHACAPCRSSVRRGTRPGRVGRLAAAPPPSPATGGGPACGALARSAGPAGDPPGDLVGDDDGEHDRALDDRDHRRREVGDLQRHRAPGRGRRTAARRARSRPGWLRPSSATAMPRKPRPAVKSVRVGVGAAEQVGQADQAGDRARRAASS